MSEVSPFRVALLGLVLVGLGTVGFHEIPGMIKEDAGGSKMVNAVYCAIITLTTVGFGDICPGDIQAAGRFFIILLALSGLGMFCGPIMDLTGSWKDTLADKLGLLTLMVTTGIFLFSYLLDEMSESEAAYFSIITGTTIGYGDISPKSDAGKLAVALYAVLSVGVVGTILQPAKDYLVSFCLVPTTEKARKGSQQSTSSAETKPVEEKNADSTDSVTDENSKTKKKKKKKKKKSIGENEEATENKKDQ